MPHSPNTVVRSDEDGMRLVQWLQAHYAPLPFSAAQRLIRTGQVRLDGKRAKPDSKVFEGMTVRVPPMLSPAAPDANVSKKKKSSHAKVPDALIEEIRSAVLFKDDRLIVLNKPAGLAVQGGTGVKHSVDSLLPFLSFDLNESPRLVHRLDRDTSGVLLLARTRKAAAWLTELFRTHRVEKTYWALVSAIPDPLKGKIDAAIEKQYITGEYEQMTASESGKEAVTLYDVKELSDSQLAWVALNPITGRTHQLRVHMASIGCPIVGDRKYGAGKPPVSGLSSKLHLHARQVVLKPANGETALSFTAPLPEHMRKSWEILGFKAKRS